MATHVRVLGACFLLLGGVGVGIAAVVLAGPGGVAAIAASADNPDTAPFLGVVAAATGAVAAVLALPSLAAGIGLLRFRPWARVLGVVLAALGLLGFPVGTAFGTYALWVLLSRETEPLFSGPTARATGAA